MLWYKPTSSCPDPPQNTSVSVLPAGELQDELPVTLTCSSDANPPVHTYVWYQDAACVPTADKSFYLGRQTQATPTGRGPTFRSANITIDQHGQHCCVARNIHGSQTYSITLRGSRGENEWKACRSYWWDVHTQFRPWLIFCDKSEYKMYLWCAFEDHWSSDTSCLPWTQFLLLLCKSDLPRPTFPVYLYSVIYHITNQPNITLAEYVQIYRDASDASYYNLYACINTSSPLFCSLQQWAHRTLQEADCYMSE